MEGQVWQLKGLEDENARLKRLLADAMLDNAALKGSFVKEVVTPAAKRNAVAHPQGRTPHFYSLLGHGTVGQQGIAQGQLLIGCRHGLRQDVASHRADTVLSILRHGI